MPFAKIVKCADDCIDQLERGGPWDILFLDHDLDGEAYVDPSEPNTGSEVVRWIVKNKPVIGEIIIHTHNEGASVNMAKDLYMANYKVARKRFLSLKLDSYAVNNDET